MEEFYRSLRSEEMDRSDCSSRRSPTEAGFDFSFSATGSTDRANGNNHRILPRIPLGSFAHVARLGGGGSVYIIDTLYPEYHWVRLLASADLRSLRLTRHEM